MENNKSRLLFTLYNNEDTTGLKNLSAEEREKNVDSYNNKIKHIRQTIHQITLDKDGITNRHELKFWLINTISSFQIPKQVKYSRFTNILQKNLHSKFAEQFILFACYKTPKSIARVLMNKPKLFEKFFLQNAPRINAWFSFKFSGKNENGALALEQYLFMNRDDLWENLKWQGRRDVPPCIAIQKKNLLMELDLVKTLELLSKDNSKNRTNFWESDFFKDSLVTGEFLELDYQYFAEAIVQILENGTTSEKQVIIEAIERYIDEEEYKELAQKLLHLVEPQDLLHFIYKLQSSKDNYSTMSELLTVVYLCEVKWETLDDLLIANAVLNYGKQLVKGILEEGSIYRESLDNWIQETVPFNNAENVWKDIYGHWLYRENQKPLELYEMSLYESFLIMYRLYKYLDDESYFEEIMQKEQLTFENSTVKTKKNRDQKGESKRRKKAKEIEQFMGFKFQEPESFSMSNVVSANSKMTPIHPLTDTVVYLAHYFLYKFICKL